MVLLYVGIFLAQVGANSFAKKTKGSVMSCESLSPDELLALTQSVRKRLDFNKIVDISLVVAGLYLAIQRPSSAINMRI